MTTQKCGPQPKSTPVMHPTVACGRLTSDPDSPDCPLILFGADGIASFTAEQVAPDGTRGWRITTSPIPLASAFDLVFTLGHVFLDPSHVETPPVQPIITHLGIVNLGDGTAQVSVTIYLEDTTTGTPIDPCCGSNGAVIIPFTAMVCGGGFFVADNLPSPCPPPGPAARPASATAAVRDLLANARSRARV